MSLHTSSRINALMAELRELLAEHNRQHPIKVEVDEDGYLEREGWVQFVVTPREPGARAYEYVRILEELESELRKRVGDERVVLLPAYPA